MSCDDLDRLRIDAPQSDSSAWPQEAQQHLASCDRCARLQVSLEKPASVDFPDVLRTEIEAVVLTELQPVSPLPGVFEIITALLLCSAVVIALANWRLGTAGWHARDVLQVSVNFSLLGISVLALANLLAHRMSPGSRSRIPALVAVAAPILALLAADLALFDYRWNPSFVPLAFSCWVIGVLSAAISAPLFWFILRRGLPLSAVGHAATVGLLAGLTGVIVLEIYCPYLDRLHTSAAHLGAAVTAVLVGATWGLIQNRVRRRA